MVKKKKFLWLFVFGLEHKVSLLVLATSVLIQPFTSESDDLKLLRLLLIHFVRLQNGPTFFFFTAIASYSKSARRSPVSIMYGLAHW